MCNLYLFIISLFVPYPEGLRFHASSMYRIEVYLYDNNIGGIERFRRWKTHGPTEWVIFSYHSRIYYSSGCPNLLNAISIVIDAVTKRKTTYPVQTYKGVV